MLGRALLLAGAASLLGCSRDRSLVLVSNEDAGEITVIDAARGAVARTVPVGKRPRGIAFAGGRADDHELRDEIDGALERHRDEVRALLRSFALPDLPTP